ncbi:MAG: hypothetical protein ACFE8U_18110 [Candidatus Hermodarchaeota archaeon]
MMNKKRLTSYFIIISIIILITSINVHAQWSPYIGFNFYGNPYGYGWNLPFSYGWNQPIDYSAIRTPGQLPGYEWTEERWNYRPLSASGQYAKYTAGEMALLGYGSYQGATYANFMPSDNNLQTSNYLMLLPPPGYIPGGPPIWHPPLDNTYYSPYYSTPGVETIGPYGTIIGNNPDED